MLAGVRVGGKAGGGGRGEGAGVWLKGVGRGSQAWACSSQGRQRRAEGHAPLAHAPGPVAAWRGLAPVPASLLEHGTANRPSARAHRASSQPPLARTLKLPMRSSAAMRLLDSISRAFSSSTSVTLNSMLRPTSSSKDATRCGRAGNKAAGPAERERLAAAATAAAARQRGPCWRHQPGPAAARCTHCGQAGSQAGVGAERAQRLAPPPGPAGSRGRT